MSSANGPRLRALVSVSDKTGLLPFVTGLNQLGFEIVSTGGTRKTLLESGLPVTDISEYTGFPEMMDGRVKTLHPRVHGGLLGRPTLASDSQSMQEHGILPFQLVVCNLYPFEATVARPDCTWELAVENIDIGGPSMIRSAAKNHEHLAVVTHPRQYDRVLSALRSGGLTHELRRELAGEAFEATARYDRAIANYFARVLHPGDLFPQTLAPLFERRGDKLRYGENPQQEGAFYVEPRPAAGTLASARQLHGKELSYNNLLDLDAATRLAALIETPAAIVVKHTNPCGAAAAADVATALSTAMAADPVSAFGSILAVNRTFDRACAEVLLGPGLFVEVVAAPAFDPEAVRLLTTKPTWKASVRLVEVPAGDPWESTHGMELRSVAGAILAQRPDDTCDDPATWRVATKVAPAPELTPALDFAFTIVRRLTSNAIAVCQGPSLVGAGIGQTSRVDATRIALEKAGERARGAVLASDAFFPFADSIPLIARAGVAAIVQPGGSKRDAEVIAAADEAGIPMVFTARRHFRH